MIDIELTILNIVRAGGGHELAITERIGNDGAHFIEARTTAVHARYLHKQGTGATMSIALTEVANKLGVEAPIALRDDLCHICGQELDPSQPFDGHPECREQE